MKDIWLIIIIYLVAVNLFGLILMGVDKSRAKRRKWRIPEATLFLVAVIGGSLGLSDAIKERCNEFVSFGKMTFPHQLARVMLLEQVYRAFKILKGEPYHK